jgi:hypothetical protein
MRLFEIVFSFYSVFLQLLFYFNSYFFNLGLQ